VSPPPRGAAAKVSRSTISNIEARLSVELRKREYKPFSRQ
jgi:hypothetical protein